MRVAIDPGHFGGTFSVLEKRHFILRSQTPVKEGDLNLRVAEKLKILLEKKAYEILLTRGSYDNFEPAKTFTIKDYEDFSKKDLKARADKIKEFKADLVILNHFNATCYSSEMFESKHNGVMTFISNSKDNKLVKAAKIFAKELSVAFNLPFCKKEWFMPEVAKNWQDIGDGVNIRDLYILRETKEPIVLTEGPLMNHWPTYQGLVKNSESFVTTYVEALLKSVEKIFLSDKS